MPVLRVSCPAGELRQREAALVRKFGLERAGAGSIAGELLETFDGRLVRDGGIVERRPGVQGAELVWTDLDLIGERGRVDDAPPPPIAAADLPAGPVALRLAGLLGERALLPVGRLTRRRRVWHRRDARGKVVLRVFVDEEIGFEPSAAAREVRLPAQIHVEGLRGYEAAFESARDRLTAAWGLPPESLPWATVLLREAGLRPGEDPSSLAFDLDAGAPAPQGFCRAFEALLAAIVANREGTRDALDPEFLHDLRVAIRRTRSLLSAAEGVLPEPLRARFAAEFKWLGGETGDLRDLDVWLLHFDDFVARAPRVPPADLEPLRALLRERQTEQRRRVADALESERAQVLLADWQALLRSEGWQQSAAADAGRTLRAVASDRIRAAERRVLRLGRSIDAESPDEDVHELRKRAKKLRYLLEFFGDMIQSKAARARITELKGLQDNLGTHQDRAVQIEAMQSLARELTAAPPQTLLAMGFLVERLDKDRRQMRRELTARIAAFDDEKARTSFRASLDEAARDDAVDTARQERNS